MRHIVCGHGKDSKQTKMAHCCVVFCTNDIRYKERYFAETGKQLHFHHFPHFHSHFRFLGDRL